MKRNDKTEHLAKSFYTFLRDPSTTGGSYASSTPLPNTVSYNVMGYQIETRFTNEHQCKLKITGNLELEELVSIPYNKSSKEPKPEWKKFYEGIFILIRQKLTNSK